MLRIILSYGTLAGLLIGIPTFGSFVLLGENHPGGVAGMALGYSIMLLGLSLVFLAIKRRRDELGGVIRFLPAFGLGLAISLAASVFYVVAWEAAQAVTRIDYIGGYIQSAIAEKRAAGASAAEIARFSAEMAAFKVQYADPLFRIPMTLTEILPVGILVSLVSAGLLCNARFLPSRAAPRAA
ncbi:DUF4199 domain-containing protein [Sphingomonas psychrotolerans]|uniref:DUF4199 domain-containing protein n=1 Tax=Sphingomonas psychrotolerans TaxID=1327635 RepID=A0ABU3N7B8_9SPHN|nr:DUF4199 domain-containing protein [Sphingomonas psychrotolerans]MDT8760422.1 DUF4199 domain-containing protein [Sphingomonas psychrotolerans]